MEIEAEEVAEMTWRSMEAIAESQPPRITTLDEVKKVVSKLNTKKAKDSTKWGNRTLKAGGEEMSKSITNIINEVDKQRTLPHDWHKMQIKSIHKKGEKTVMSNKRGLFLTNNVSKVYERVVKKRNDEKFKDTI